MMPTENTFYLIVNTFYLRMRDGVGSPVPLALSHWYSKAHGVVHLIS